MIEITQVGQAGKTKLLFDMYRLRASVFKDSLKWDVYVDKDGLEVDQFDIPETVYILGMDGEEKVVGSWRMLSTMGPTMIRDIWPQFLESLPMPRDEDIFELSRFTVKLRDEDAPGADVDKQRIIAEMFCGLTEVCIKAGIKELYTLYDERVEGMLQRIDCHPYKVSEKLEVDDYLCKVGAFKVNDEVLRKMQKASGINYSVIDRIELPLLVAKRLEDKESNGEK